MGKILQETIVTSHWTFSPIPLSPKDRLIVGVSGGADSVALLGLLVEQLPRPQKRLVVAHVNYGLRGTDSLKDEKRVRQLSREWSLPFRCLRVKSLKKRASQERKSLQDWARHIRYSFFQKLSERERAWGVAVAHHREDQAETILDRLLRGAAARGLSGLRPLQSLGLKPGLPALRVWRPLLPYTKDQIRGYLLSRGIAWREDRSNRRTQYRRNQIRHEVLPFLSKWNPNLKEVLARLGEISSAEDELLEGLLSAYGRKLKGRWGGRAYACDARRFQAMPLALQRRWVRRVSERLNGEARGLSFDRIGEIIRLWEGRQRGPRDVGFQLTAGKSQNRAFLTCKGAVPSFPGPRFPPRI